MPRTRRSERCAPFRFLTIERDFVVFRELTELLLQWDRAAIVYEIPTAADLARHLSTIAREMCDSAVLPPDMLDQAERQLRGYLE